LSDVLDRGITVTESGPLDQPIDVTRETTAAFVGRTLRGPLNEPILVSSLGEFRRYFGDVWSRSSLGPAVQQFFEHGGGRVTIVRVANGAKGAMACLPASGSALVLRALQPGSTERIRVAVDYDGIDAGDAERFNLTLQRVSAVTGLVSDQELYRRSGVIAGRDNYIADLMLSSSIARVAPPWPTHRPEATVSDVNTGGESDYVRHAQDGVDGQELSDYDLVGSRRARSGLFALQGAARFDVLYLPPPGKGRDLGPTAVLAAERFCRERGAMLVVDPHSEWLSSDQAIRGVNELGYSSPNMLGYFPRMRYRDDQDSPTRAVGGAVAGLLCKLDRNHGAWQEPAASGLGLHRSLVPAISLDDTSRQTLARAGINSIHQGPGRASRFSGNVTMARGSAARREFVSLPVRRLSLQIIHALDEATQLAAYGPSDAATLARIRSKITAYFSALADMGALVNDDFSVQCETSLSADGRGIATGITILIALQPAGCDQCLSITLHQTAAGCRHSA
jgi:phage tail sheath protein FI